MDTASRQLDQMIDQARYKHQQHRTKFKEAIDYLDQIFEDLKRECNTPDAAGKNQPKNPSKNPQKPDKFPVGNSSNVNQVQARNKVGSPEGKNGRPVLQKSVSQDAGASV